MNEPVIYITSGRHRAGLQGVCLLTVQSVQRSRCYCQVGGCAVPHSWRATESRGSGLFFRSHLSEMNIQSGIYEAWWLFRQCQPLTFWMLCHSSSHLSMYCWSPCTNPAWSLHLMMEGQRLWIVNNQGTDWHKDLDYTFFFKSQSIYSYKYVVFLIFCLLTHFCCNFACMTHTEKQNKTKQKNPDLVACPCPGQKCCHQTGWMLR